MPPKRNSSGKFVSSKGFEVRKRNTSGLFKKSSTQEPAMKKSQVPAATSMLKEASKLGGNDSAAAYMDNWIDTYYPRRDGALNNMSLFNLMLHFEIVGEKSTLRDRLHERNIDGNGALEDSDEENDGGQSGPRNGPSVY
ncbi:hypothetical protein QR680_003484 [Steinernema hermaphroditum]|uniref:Uncharacterized protein n=1 Tax=Steinernema hermaphroditum TaxID=289476 RepID=A0AA39HLK1_9BILA|nr:hypothetical protein QR680_003484 [Steinernema hermaphroditum]